MENVQLTRQEKQDQIVTKSVSAIHIGARLSLTQRKLVNALLYHAYDTLLIDDTHTIPIPLLMEIIGFESRNQAHLKKAIRGLTETSIEWDMMDDDGSSVWEVATLLSYARIQDGKCTYRYDKSLAEKLHDPSVFAKINLSVVRDIRSAHTLALYENCFRYVGIGRTPKWGIEVFRRLMAVEGLASYQQFKVLKRDLIVPSMKEINTLSNINVELLTEKKGRTIATVQFLVKRNPQMALMGIEEDDEISSSAAYKPLIEAGFNKAVVRAWVLEYGENYLLDKLGLVTRLAAKGKIKSSKAGFLKAAIEQDYQNEAAQDKKRAAEAQKVLADRAITEKQIKDLREALRKAETDYRWAVAGIIQDNFDRLDMGERTAIQEEFESGLKGHIYREAFRKNGWRDRLVFPDIVAFWSARDLPLPSATNWAQEKGLESVEALKAKIKGLERDLKQQVVSVNPI